MKNSKNELLKAYMTLGVSPILVENVSVDTFKNPVVLDAGCSSVLLNGHYDNDEFSPPLWYKELINSDIPVLFINEINSVCPNEQSKFIEILKYNKISTFNLPSNCMIIVTCRSLKEFPINSEVYSLLAHI